MNTSQNQNNSNFVLDSYLMESRSKSISKIIDASIWMMLISLLVLFAAMLIDAYQNGLITFHYNIVTVINFIIGFSLIVFLIPTSIKGNQIIKNTSPEPFKSSTSTTSIKVAITASTNVKPCRLLKTVESKSPINHTDYKFNPLSFGHNMQFNGLFANKPSIAQATNIQ